VLQIDAREYPSWDGYGLSLCLRHVFSLSTAPRRGNENEGRGVTIANPQNDGLRRSGAKYRFAANHHLLSSQGLRDFLREYHYDYDVAYPI
jgi:hypothetical protein